MITVDKILRKPKFSKREYPLVVSLTSYPSRINTVYRTINSLLNQSIKADKIILWLGEEQFPNKEADLPENLLMLQEKGLTIGWCEDIRSYTKLIPALEKYPESIIVTADDDIIYPPKWLQKLYQAYKKQPDMIHCHRAHRILFDDKGAIKPYNDWIGEIRKAKPSYNNFLTGVGGVLYPPNILHSDIKNKDLFQKLAPMADDIWFWAMAVLNDIKINLVNRCENSLVYVDGTQEKEALWKTNVSKNKNDIQLKNVLEYYPQILNKLDKKNFKRVFMPVFLKQIFSIQNRPGYDFKKIVITILGIKIQFKIQRKPWDLCS